MGRKPTIFSYDFTYTGDKIYTMTLSSGLNVLLIYKPGFTKKFASYCVNYGSDDICFKKPGDITKTVLPFGTAHFLEHKLFEQKNENAMEAFGRLGIKSNAGTGHTGTSYYFNCTDNFEKGLKLLMNFVTNPYFTDENVEKEKGIIAQEIGMYDDRPEEVCSINMLQAMYRSNYIRYDIAGKKEDIEKIDKDILMKAYEAFYTPENSILVVSGDIDPEDLLYILEEKATVKFRGSGLPERITPNEPGDPDETYVECEMSAANTLFEVGFKDSEKRFTGKKGIMNSIGSEFAEDILVGNQTEFYESLYKKGLINRSFGTGGFIGRTGAFASFQGESENPRKVVEELTKEYERILKDGIDDKMFRTIKNANLGNIVKYSDYPSSLGRFFASKIMEGYDIFDYFDCCATISKEDVEENFRWFLGGTPVLSVVKPKK